jgi:hypothetical protein
VSSSGEGMRAWGEAKKKWQLVWVHMSMFLEEVYICKTGNKKERERETEWQRYRDTEKEREREREKKTEKVRHIKTIYIYICKYLLYICTFLGEGSQPTFYRYSTVGLPKPW